MKRMPGRAATGLKPAAGTVADMLPRAPAPPSPNPAPKPAPKPAPRASVLARLLRGALSRLLRAVLRSLGLGLFPVIGVLVAGCSSESDFAREGDTWRYRGQPIEGADAKSFKVLDAHHAKDHQHAWYADTERKGQEYYLVRHVVIRRIDGADAASLAVLKSGYARDRAAVYFKGQRFAVADVTSFEVLDYDFARDARQGYYERKPIALSQGASFAVLDLRHAADAARVYFVPQRSDPEHTWGRGADELQPREVRGAERASFEVLGAGWARDAKTLFHAGRPVRGDPASFQTLDRGYTRAEVTVFYLGQAVAGAEAASFEVLASVDEADGADARDARARYARGVALKAPLKPPLKPAGRATPGR